MGNHPPSLDAAKAALKKVAAPVAAALDTDFLAFLCFWHVHARGDLRG